MAKQLYRVALETLERETGIEPATNSLEGCDSTTELLPPCSLPNLGPSASPQDFACRLPLHFVSLTPANRLNLEGCDSTTELLPPTASKLELMIGIEPMTSPLPREC